MKRLIVLAVLLAVGCVSAESPGVDLPPAAARRDARVLRVRTGGRVVDVPLEAYVLGSVLSELTPVGAPPEAARTMFEVQAVLARTYAVAHPGRHRAEGFDLCDAVHCQLYQPERIGTSRFTAVAREAVERTRGLVVLYDGRPADVVYHSDCGGRTADAASVWGGPPVPYLRSVVDRVPGLTHHTWVWTVDAARLRTALNADPRSAVGARLRQITIVQTDESGRAARIRLDGTAPHTLRGEDLRAIVNRTFGDRAIQSTKFQVTRTGAVYRFQGAGFGHGVGLCQTGAAARARAGESPAAILQAYFPGTTLGPMGN